MVLGLGLSFSRWWAGDGSVVPEAFTLYVGDLSGTGIATPATITASGGVVSAVAATGSAAQTITVSRSRGPASAASRGAATVLVCARMTEGQAAQWRGTPGVTILAEAPYGPNAADEIYDAIWSDPAALALYRAVYDPQPVTHEDGSVTVAPERFGVMA